MPVFILCSPKHSIHLRLPPPTPSPRKISHLEWNADPPGRSCQRPLLQPQKVIKRGPQSLKKHGNNSSVELQNCSDAGTIEEMARALIWNAQRIRMRFIVVRKQWSSTIGCVDWPSLESSSYQRNRATGLWCGRKPGWLCGEGCRYFLSRLFIRS